jgi:hypothetical protein
VQIGSLPFQRALAHAQVLLRHAKKKSYWRQQSDFIQRRLRLRCRLAFALAGEQQFTAPGCMVLLFRLQDRDDIALDAVCLVPRDSGMADWEGGVAPREPCVVTPHDASSRADASRSLSACNHCA